MTTQWAELPRDRGSIPGTGTTFISLPKGPDVSVPSQWVLKNLLSGVKRPGRHADLYYPDRDSE